MTGSGERIGPLLVWPDDPAAHLWRYLPAAPSAQRGETGRPSVTVMEAGGMVMLTVGARLGADEADLAAVRKVLAARAGLAEAGVDLRPAEAAVSGAVLVLHAADGTETTLASARPSPLPPYPPAFSAMLSGETAAAARAGLPEGRLLVRYELSLPQDRRATAQLAGRWDGEGSVDSALETGALTLTVVADDGASPALVRRAADRARAEAARSARRIGLDPSPVQSCGPAIPRAGTFVEVTETEPAPLALRLESSLRDWMR